MSPVYSGHFVNLSQVTTIDRFSCLIVSSNGNEDDLPDISFFCVCSIVKHSL